MEYRQLGRTDIKVSAICLGTMTWGEQNTLEEAHQQLDYALERGVNFIDTAEMYPVPPVAETYTQTEQIIGKWDKLKSSRDKVIVATKVAGPSEMMSYIRGGSKLNKEHITQAVEGSLERLAIDYIDLYQLHWPERSTNFFGQLGYVHKDQQDLTPLQETLEVLQELQKAGKVRAFGLSNETPWGTMKYLELSEKLELPRMVSVQNPYNLLNRTYEVGMAEVSHREDIGLLAYSPMAFGVLSGKYLDGKRPADARLTLWDRFSRYTGPEASSATEAYVKLAQKYNLSPAQLSLAFVTSRPFVTSNIIGATKMEQLKENLDSIELTINQELMQEIEAIHTRWPNPAP
jgi:aryl-alcohol dehydrogenase-like predicted oxidoreductase